MYGQGDGGGVYGGGRGGGGNGGGGFFAAIMHFAGLAMALAFAAAIAHPFWAVGLATAFVAAVFEKPEWYEKRRKR